MWILALSTRPRKPAAYLMLDDLSERQVQVDLTFAEEFEVAAAASGLSLALDPVGQLQLYQARFEAHGPHGRSGGRHLDPLQTQTCD